MLFTLLAAVLLLPALLYGAARGTGASHNKALAVPQLRPGPLPLALPAADSAAGPASPAVPSPSPSGKKKNKNKKNKQQQQQQDVAANHDIASSGVVHSSGVPVDAVQERSSGSSSSTQQQHQQGHAVNSNAMLDSQKQTVAAGTAGAGEDAADSVRGSGEVAAEQQGAFAADSPSGRRSNSKDTQHGTSAAPQQAGQDAASHNLQQQQKQQQQQQLLLQAASLARTAVEQPGASSSASKSTLASPVAPLSTHSVASGSSAPTSPVPLLPSPTPEGAAAAAAATAMSPTGGSSAAGDGADAAAAAGHGAPMMQHHRSYVDADGAVVIGRLRVGPKELGFGSAGELMHAVHKV